MQVCGSPLSAGSPRGQRAVPASIYLREPVSRTLPTFAAHAAIRGFCGVTAPNR